MKVANRLLADNVDASVDFVTQPFLIDFMFGFSIQAVVNGSPIGLLSLQCSDEPGNINADNADVANWDDVAGSSQAINGAGSGTYNVNASFSRWIRAKYLKTSGSGNISIYLNSKGG